MPRNSPRATVNVRILRELKEQLQKLAEEQERPVSYFVEKAVARYLEDVATTAPSP